MRNSIRLAIALIISLAAVQPAVKGGIRADARAKNILEQARAAIGGQSLDSVRGMVVGGRYRRVARNQEQSGEAELRFLLPDKFMKSETMNVVGGIDVTFIKALNGNQAWSDSKTNSTGGQVTLIRPQSAGQAGEVALANELRSDFIRYSIGLLLSAPPSFPVEFSYIGTANAGTAQADVIAAKGSGGFDARVFLDKKTHVPLMLSYRGAVAGNTIAGSTSGATGDLKRLVEDAKKRAEAQNRDQRESEVAIHFDDYRPENGILLPRRITRAVNGKTVEEFDVTIVKINPKALTAAKFEKASR